MADKKKVTAPSGLNIQRDGGKFTVKWKKGQTYNLQELYYAIKTGSTKKSATWSKWTKITVTAGATSKSKTLTNTNYFPAVYTSGAKSGKYKPHLFAIKFKVRGRQKIDKSQVWSAWKTVKMVLTPPTNPTVTIALSSSLDNVSTVTVTPKVKDNDKKWYTACEWESVLMPGSAKPNYKSTQLGWQTGQFNNTSARTLTFTEDAATLAKGSYTRYFRVRARGPAGSPAGKDGKAAWVQVKHVYAKPYAVTGLKASAKASASGYTVSASCMVKMDAAHPIESVIYQYTIAEPAAGLSCPSGAAWETCGTDKPLKAGKSACVFSVNDQVGEDECLFVQVITRHDHATNDTICKPVLATGGIGKLKTPSGLNVSTDDQMHKITVLVENESSVEDAHLAIVYTHASDPNDKPIIGIIPHPTSSGSQSAIVQAPNWTGETAYGVEVFAFVGQYTSTVRADGVTVYNIPKVLAKSEVLTYGGEVPCAPENVKVDAADTAETARLSWDWSWERADSAEISWSDRPDAWESTDEPETYTISHMHAAAWNIAGLEAGVRWYFRVRLLSGTGDNVTAGPWSETVDIVLSTVPIKPDLALSARVAQPGGSVTASWAYVSTDGTTQEAAEVCPVVLDATGEVDHYGDPVARLAEETQAVITDDWQASTTYYYAVRVRSASGRWSDWSDPEALIIAEPLNPEMIISQGAEVVTVTDDEGLTHDAYSITSLPIYVQVNGAGEGGTVTLIIERAEEYHVDRPDESDFDGYEGQTVYLRRYQAGDPSSNDPIMVDVGDFLSGQTLDDGALYRIIADVEDTYGQTARVDTVNGAGTDIVEVHWDHQPEAPEATALVDGTTVRLSATAPESAETGDSIDIYRLSADRPEKIVEGGNFGTTYIDPYPAIGPNGGHRIVMKTKYGDYITADNAFAWVDLQEEEGDIIETDKTLIDFDGEQLELFYSVSTDNDWKKDFQQTVYLGGSIQGDWNPGIQRTGEVSAVTITVLDEDTMRKIRRLATWAGLCHLRTQDGSSFPCDIQVSSGAEAGKKGMITEYTLKVTRVDPPEFEGYTA